MQTRSDDQHDLNENMMKFSHSVFSEVEHSQMGCCNQRMKYYIMHANNSVIDHLSYQNYATL